MLFVASSNSQKVKYKFWMPPLRPVCCLIAQVVNIFDFSVKLQSVIQGIASLSPKVQRVLTPQLVGDAQDYYQRAMRKSIAEYRRCVQFCQPSKVALTLRGAFAVQIYNYKPHHSPASRA